MKKYILLFTFLLPLVGCNNRDSSVPQATLTKVEPTQTKVEPAPVAVAAPVASKKEVPADTTPDSRTPAAPVPVDQIAGSWAVNANYDIKSYAFVESWGNVE